MDEKQEKQTSKNGVDRDANLVSISMGMCWAYRQIHGVDVNGDIVIISPMANYL